MLRWCGAAKRAARGAARSMVNSTASRGVQPRGRAPRLSIGPAVGAATHERCSALPTSREGGEGGCSSPHVRLLTGLAPTLQGLQLGRRSLLVLLLSVQFAAQLVAMSDTSGERTVLVSILCSMLASHVRLGA